MLCTCARVYEVQMSGKCMLLMRTETAVHVNFCASFALARHGPFCEVKTLSIESPCMALRFTLLYPVIIVCVESCLRLYDINRGPQCFLLVRYFWRGLTSAQGWALDCTCCPRFKVLARRWNGTCCFMKRMTLVQHSNFASRHHSTVFRYSSKQGHREFRPE